MCSTLRTYSSSAWFVVAHELRHMCGAMKSNPSCRVVVQVDPPTHKRLHQYHPGFPIHTPGHINCVNFGFVSVAPRQLCSRSKHVLSELHGCSLA